MCPQNSLPKVIDGVQKFFKVRVPGQVAVEAANRTFTRNYHEHVKVTPYERKYISELTTYDVKADGSKVFVKTSRTEVWYVDHSMPPHEKVISREFTGIGR